MELVMRLLWGRRARTKSQTTSPAVTTPTAPPTNQGQREAAFAAGGSAAESLPAEATAFGDCTTGGVAGGTGGVETAVCADGGVSRGSGGGAGSGSEGVVETDAGAGLEGGTATTVGAGAGDGTDAVGWGTVAFVAGMGAGAGLASSSTDVPALVPTIMSGGNDGATGAGA